MSHQWAKNFLLSVTLLLSISAQAQWTRNSTGLEGANVHALAISPVSSDNLYALSGSFYNDNLPISDFFLTSDNFGLNWVSRSLGFPEITFSYLVPSHISAHTLLALSHQGIYKSTNNGKDWSNVYPAGGPIQDLKICQKQQTILYAYSLFTNELLKSTDEGESWVTIFLVPPRPEGAPPSFAPPFLTDLGPTQIAIDHDNCDTLYLISENRMGKSVDGGETWSLLNNSGLPENLFVTSITTGLNSNVLFIAWRDGAAGIYRSTDGGSSWHPANTGIESVGIENVIIDPIHENRLFALNKQGLWRTVNGGDSWQRIAQQLQNTPLKSLAIDPANSDRIYLATSVGIFQSVDGGTEWQIHNTGMHDLAHINSLQTLGSGDDAIVFAATTVGGFRLDSSSTDWQRLGGIAGTLPLDDLVSTESDLWAVASQRIQTRFEKTNPIFHSQDEGQHWRSLSVDTIEITKFASLSALPGHRVPYLGGVQADGTRVIYRGLDDSLSWQPLADNLPQLLSNKPVKPFGTPKPQVSINPASPDSFYIDSVYRFTPQDEQQFSHPEGLPSKQQSGIMAFDPFDASRQYAGVNSVDGHGFYISEDGGASWRPTGLRTFNVYAIQIDPDDRNVIYVVHQGGIAKSTDAGESWLAFNQGLNDVFPSTGKVFWLSATLAIKGDKLLVGTNNGILTCGKSACQSDTPATATIIEFYNTQLDHYFLTPSQDEAKIIDAGHAGSGWVRTGETIGTWQNPGQASPEALEVCRFYAPGANTHFYSLANSECESLMASPDWILEHTRFYLYQNNAEFGCPTDSEPVYRLYNNRFQIYNDSNHRYTTKMSIVDEMKAKNWTLEGVAFCAPL